MDISGIASGKSQAGTAAKSLSENFDTFLQLLTAQLKNQDPLEPMDSSEFTQQLVQYSSVEQGIHTNKNLESLIALQGYGIMGNAVSYIGREVTAETAEAALVDGQASWTYTLPVAANAVSLTVKDSSGKTIYAGTGPKTAGDNTVTWDGKTSSGADAPPGIYTLSVKALDANENELTTSIKAKGRVSSIETVDGEVMLTVGGVRIRLSDVMAVREVNTATDDDGEDA